MSYKSVSDKLEEMLDKAEKMHEIAGEVQELASDMIDAMEEMMDELPDDDDHKTQTDKQLKDIKKTLEEIQDERRRKPYLPPVTYPDPYIQGIPGPGNPSNPWITYGPTIKSKDITSGTLFCPDDSVNDMCIKE